MTGQCAMPIAVVSVVKKILHGIICDIDSKGV